MAAIGNDASMAAAQARPKRFTIAGYRAPVSSTGGPALLTGVPGPLTSAGSGIVASGMGGYGPGGATHVGSGDNRSSMPGISTGPTGSVIGNNGGSGNGNGNDTSRPPGSSSGQNTAKGSGALPQLNLKGTSASGNGQVTGTNSISGISSMNGNNTNGGNNGGMSNGNSNGNGVTGVGDATPRTTARDAKRRTYAPAGATARAADAATAGKLPVAASGGSGGMKYINRRGTYEGTPLSPHAPQSARASGDSKTLMSNNGSMLVTNGTNDDINASDYGTTNGSKGNGVSSVASSSSAAATATVSNNGVATSRMPNTDRGSLAPSSIQRTHEGTTTTTTSAVVPSTTASSSSGGPSSSMNPSMTSGVSTGAVTTVGSSSGSGSTSRTSRGAARTSGGDRVAKPPAKVRQPMTPAETMRRFADLLTPFEQSEVLEYQQVYFVGQPGVPKIKGIPHTTNNNGYDDERGDYKVVQSDHLEYRYEVLGLLGRGSFGQVVKVLDHKKDAVLALKVIRNKKRFHHQALVEVKILEHLMGRDKEHKSNIVRVHGYFYFRNHLCITFEPLSINLYEFIKNNNFKGVSLSLIRRFAIQLLHALKFLRSERIIHCDLKPENVLLKSPNKSTIRLIDFGSSCFEDERIYTYIQSRFYRSPEVILGLPYDIAIDMWSFGCILSELYTGYPLFPGENETEQIQCIMEVLGVPPKRLIQASTRKKTFFDANLKPLTVPNSRGKIRHPGGKDLASATKCTDPQFISFLKKCLRWDPKLRITPEKALEHAWITEVVPPPQPPPQPGVQAPPPRPSSDDDEDDKDDKVAANTNTNNITNANANATSTSTSTATGNTNGNGNGNGNGGSGHGSSAASSSAGGSDTKRRSGGRTTGNASSSGNGNSNGNAASGGLVPTAPTTAAPAIDPRASIRASGGTGATASMTSRSIMSTTATAATTARGSGDSLEQLLQQNGSLVNTDNNVSS